MGQLLRIAVMVVAVVGATRALGGCFGGCDPVCASGISIPVRDTGVDVVPTTLLDVACETGTCTCTTGNVVVQGTAFCSPTTAFCDCYLPPDAGTMDASR